VAKTQEGSPDPHTRNTKKLLARFTAARQMFHVHHLNCVRAVFRQNSKLLTCQLFRLLQLVADMLAHLCAIALKLIRVSVAIGQCEMMIGALQTSLNRLLGEGTVGRSSTRLRVTLRILPQQSCCGQRRLSQKQALHTKPPWRCPT